MVRQDQIESSKAIQQRTGKTFHVATRVLPERVRYPTYVLYAFFRIADEVVDDPDPGPPEEQRAELERIRAAAKGERETDDAVLTAVDELRERHDIPDREIDVFVDAMAMDVEKHRYEDHGELSEYLRGSAVAVGQMMLEVMDPGEKETARPHAAALGEAFQLTNFLRDVREDVVDFDRIYLPRQSLAAHGLDFGDVEDLDFSASFAEVMRDELARTEELYHEGVDGIRYLPEDCQLAVLTAAVLYADQHRLIRERGYDVLSERPSLTLRRRVWLLARTWLAFRRHDDPLEAFYAVSDVEPPEDWTTGTGSNEGGDEPSSDGGTGNDGPPIPTFGLGAAARCSAGAVRSTVYGAADVVRSTFGAVRRWSWR